MRFEKTLFEDSDFCNGDLKFEDQNPLLFSIEAEYLIEIFFKI